MAIDVAAETARHLSVLSPEQLQKAVDYTHGSEWNLLWGWLAGLVVAWLILRWGGLARIRNGLEKTRPRPLLVSLVVSLVYLLVSTILSLPWAIYSGWWFQKSFGLTDQPLTGFLVDAAKGSVFGIVLGAIFYVILYAVLRKAPKTWWIWGAGLTSLFLLFVLLIAPITIEPMLNKYTPAPEGPVRAEVVAMAKQVGVPHDKIFIYDGSKQSNRYTANVSGLAGTARVAMSDVMFKKDADKAEIRGVVGHEMGHYVHQHTLWFAGALIVLSAVAFWLTGALFPLFSTLLGGRAVTGIADPAGLPILIAIISTLVLIGSPVLNSMSRFTETDADNFSLQNFNEPDGLAKALVKTAEYRAPNPSVLEETIFYDHPSVGNRVRNAMEWKAKHPPADAPASPPAAEAATPPAAPAS
ncbi:MAG: M48 family metalloprotease [Caulobacteraceae bacterium]